METRTFFDVADKWGGGLELREITGLSAGFISSIKTGREPVSGHVHRKLLEAWGREGYDYAGTEAESQRRMAARAKKSEQAA
ncbi:MAG: hypothetical protein ABIL09_10985 [Gemmatimonadota bacterium]